MKCGGCVRAVEQRLLAQPGVRQASVNLLNRTAWVGLDPETAMPEPAQPLIESLAAMGYRAAVRNLDDEDRPLSLAERQQQQSWWQRWRQLMVALLLLVFSVSGHLAEAGQLPLPPLADIRLHALVATIALLLPGRPILVQGWRSAWAGAPGMDTLVGLGMGSAYLASLVALFWPAVGWQCFFNEPVMLLGFVLMGRFLEERARFRTGRALQELARLQPDEALLLLGSGAQARVESVRVGALRPGDRLRVLPGDRIPVDSRVLEGHSSLDVSSLTGEPLPLVAGVGQELAAGSLNLQSSLELEVLRPGRESAVARIIALVESAQARKAPIQTLTDRVAGRFSVVVMLLALVTLLFWWLIGAQLWPHVLSAAPSIHQHGGHQSLGLGAETPFVLGLQLSIAVLVVACPCALGLATPTAITVGSGLAARSGVLFRGGDVIEAASHLRTLFFDKTGTLTVGRPTVRAVERSGLEGSESSLIQLAASLEAQTRHPLAHALLQRAQQLELPLLEVSEACTLAGDGVRAQVQGHGLCRVGRPAWLLKDGVEIAEDQRRWWNAQEEQGATVVAVALTDASGSSQLQGLIALDDEPRADAPKALVQLRAMGVQLGLLSGDRQAPVRHLALQLGLPLRELAWELLPQQKLERIDQARQASSDPVGMVGDGINDAPALAAADLGIAVGTGTQIAIDTADLVVLGDRLEAIPMALRLARRTMAKVRQNLIWAFGYNLVVLPIAAGVLLPGFGVVLSPPLAALLMAMSSITVVVNALLLGRHD
ncbi:heavy metal translocating P-type ATPase [Synechococcus sp. W4D4]|uniref:heavy metal translocating P-type ATPase n=1 Tax=Synechococcus sp. W4D4 TaxID=3392294 RepID=UPI0039EA7A3C